MFLPGRVLHLEPSGEGDKEQFRVTERRKEDFDEILVSPRMLSDHMPNHLDRVFKCCPNTLNIIPVLV